MKEFQALLRDTNLCLDKQEIEIEAPLIHTGMLYEVASTTLWMTQALWRIDELDSDYRGKKEGIGIVTPEIYGFQELLKSVQSAATKITAVHDRHQRTMHDMAWLCFNHIVHRFPWDNRLFKGGLFRIQITAKTATFQILFLVWHGHYAPSHEIDLKTIVEGDAFEEQPFSQIPPNIMIPAPDHSWIYVPATYAGWKAALDDIPLNSKKKATQMYRSHTVDVLESFGGMVEELLAA